MLIKDSTATSALEYWGKENTIVTSEGTTKHGKHQAPTGYI